ncbi:MAG: geranylgeranylglycerol-phosphate geranylgeranyltransferase [Candidatus Heimdallarchaeota archaeon]
MKNPWLRIMRPFNCFLISMCAIVGWTADKGISAFTEQWPALIMTFIGGWALSAAAMILNDYFDIEVDKINQPQRPIPNGEIKPKTALIVGIILVILGNLLGLGIDLFSYFALGGAFGVAIVTALINSVILIIYTNYLKRYSILGNLAVSIGVWFGFMYGDLVIDFTFNIFPETLGFAAFVLNFGREIMKGIMDIEGDRANKVTTVATAFGVKATAIISAVTYILAISSALIPIFYAEASWVYVATISVAFILAILSAIWILIDQSTRSVVIIKTIILVTMLAALVAFALEALVRDVVPPLIAST